MLLRPVLIDIFLLSSVVYVTLKQCIRLLPLTYRRNTALKAEPFLKNFSIFYRFFSEGGELALKEQIYEYGEGISADEIKEQRRIARRLAFEKTEIDRIEQENADSPVEEEPEAPTEKQKLRRELRAEALARLEHAARTPEDFQNVIAWWDKLDANRERRERYHEISRSGNDMPLDYGAADDYIIFPDNLGGVVERQERRGDFIDSIFNCPYDIHELVSEDYLCDILKALPEDSKELLYFHAIRRYRSTKIAEVRGQSDRNIRKVRKTMFKKIYKKLITALIDRREKNGSEMSRMEQEFLAAFETAALDKIKHG